MPAIKREVGIHIACKNVHYSCVFIGFLITVLLSMLQGFRKVYNLAGGIHAYVEVDPSIPTY